MNLLKYNIHSTPRVAFPPKTPVKRSLTFEMHSQIISFLISDTEAGGHSPGLVGGTYTFNKFPGGDLAP